jgi:hypothetical protein
MNPSQYPGADGTTERACNFCWLCLDGHQFEKWGNRTAQGVAYCAAGPRLWRATAIIEAFLDFWAFRRSTLFLERPRLA